ETLRTHLRRFLMVQLPDGERWYFRYYDPRILKIYLSNCRADELEIFFGPVRAFGIAESESSQVLLLHSRNEGRPIAELASSRSLRIRREQYEALEKATTEDFEQRVVRFVKNTFPARCQELGDQAVRELVAYGRKRAEIYVLTREIDQFQFI